MVVLQGEEFGKLIPFEMRYLDALTLNWNPLKRNLEKIVK